jgi:transposase
MDDRGPAPRRAGDPGDDAARHAGPLGGDDRCHPPAFGGGPPSVGLATLVVLQALSHVARDDRAWRRLPPGSPPHQTLGSRRRSWRRRAVLERALLRVVVACRRPAAGRKRRPTAAIIATPSVKTGPQRGPRGCDGNTRIKGRKRVLLIDTQGDPLGVRVVSADVQDRDARHALAPDLDVQASLLLVGLDRGCAGDDPAIFWRGYGISSKLVGTVGRKGFQVEPRRWKALPTFGCLQRYRRLRVDDEMSHAASRHMTILASVFMTAMRLGRLLLTAEFQAGS